MSNYNKILRIKLSVFEAFSLIEMSLVLAIMGTVAGLSMPMLLEQRALQKQQKSRQNIDIALTALGTYAASNSSLPCPASSSSQGEPTICNKDSTTAAVGFIPYKVLGLQESSSKDGFGHPLRYALDPSLSSKELFRGNQDPRIFIKNEKGQSLISKDLKNDRLAVVIIGEDQAYQDATSSFEMANLDQSFTFVDALFSTQKSNPFRQRVKWSTRNNLLTHYGKSAPITPPAEPGVGAQSTPAPSNTPPPTQSTGADDPDLGF